MFYLKICNDFSKPYQQIFEDSKKCFSISDFGLKQYEKASTYLTKEAKKSPLILLLDHDLW